MITNALIFLLGLILLVRGAHYFVKYASEIAKRLGASDFMIGLTLVAIGTSVPELSAAITASIHKTSGLIIGDVVGSNIANVCLIIGIATAFTTIKTDENMLYRDGQIMFFAALLLLVFASDLAITRLEAGFLLLLYAAYIFFLLESNTEQERQMHFREFFQYFYRFKYITTIRSKVYKNFRKSSSKQRSIRELFFSAIIKDLLFIALSLVAIVFGAKYLVQEAIFFAQLLNVPSTMIGLSLIALGTSLPELSVAITAARKGLGNIAIGNILGSNTANVLLILGVAGLINPLTIEANTFHYIIPFMLTTSFFLLVFIRNDWEVKRWEGLLLLVTYVIFMMTLFSGIIY
jgi:cation:H+ antiporter